MFQYVSDFDMIFLMPFCMFSAKYARPACKMIASFFSFRFFALSFHEIKKSLIGQILGLWAFQLSPSFSMRFTLSAAAIFPARSRSASADGRQCFSVPVLGGFLLIYSVFRRVSLRSRQYTINRWSMRQSAAAFLVHFSERSHYFFPNVRFVTHPPLFA